ncbi:MAG: tetratricopeptide repeat protein [Gemmataceae bacterium]|nr:tetratricopeptide repeat protein [Gemmata sp.]MDW8198693.1 tetratricopeptide repeat protein [Gemmataceae bacterium]
MFAGLFIGVLLSPVAEPARAAEAHKQALSHFGAAVWNLRRDRLLSAVQQLQAAVQAEPHATTPHKELAKLYVQLGREAQALRLARDVWQREPNDADNAVLLARLLFDAGETKEALTIVQTLLARSSLPGPPAQAVAIYRDLARLCAKAGDLASAERALQRAVELLVAQRTALIAAFAFTPKQADTQAAECLEHLGRILLQRHKPHEAVKAFDAAAKLYAGPTVADPASAARLTWHRAVAREAQGDLTEAIRQLEIYLRQQPRSPEPYQQLARWLRAAKRDEEIIPALQAYALRDKTNYALAAVLAAEMAREPTTRRNADELFTTLTTVSSDPVVIGIIVRSHLENRRALEIIKDLDRSFVILKQDKDKDQQKPETPETAAAHKFAAEKARAIAAALEQEPLGIAELLRAAADDLKNGTRRDHATYYFLGSLAARHQQLELAVLQFRQAARVAPENSLYEAYSALFDALWRLGKPADVEATCREALGSRAITRAVGELLFYYHLALALAEQGQAEAALEAADQAIRQSGDPNRLVVRLRKHRVLCVLGRWAEAIEYGHKLMDEFDAPDERQRLRYAQAGAYWGAKKNAEAEKLLRAILDDDPDHTAACNDLGYHLADQGRHLDEAERLIRHAILLDRLERRKSGSAETENAAYLDSLGWVLFRRGRLTEARDELERASALPGGATDPVVWDHLGDVLFRLNDKIKAKAAWEKALELYEADARLSSRGRRDGRLDEVKRKLARLP